METLRFRLTSLAILAPLLISSRLLAGADIVAGVPVTIPQGTEKISIYYFTTSGTRTDPAFAYNDTSSACTKTPLTYPESPRNFTITVVAANGEPLVTETGTTGQVRTMAPDCGCPYVANPPQCPPLPPNKLTSQFHLRDVNVSKLAADRDVEITLSATNIGASGSIWDPPPAKGVFQTDDIGPQIVDLEPSPDARPSGTRLHQRAMTADPKPSQVITAALGLPFEWGMILNRTGEKVACRYTLESSGNFVAVDPPLVDDSTKYPQMKTVLFKDTVLLAFGDDTPVKMKQFIGVHLGHQYFRAIPVDTKIPPALIRVDVKEPEKLGASQLSFDAELIKVANRRGIPPQYLKGQVEQESDGFNREAFRYEPFSSDAAEISRGDDLRSRANLPYRRYRMATTQPGDEIMGQGTYLDPADIVYRNTDRSPSMHYRRGGITMSDGRLSDIDDSTMDLLASEIVRGSPDMNYDDQNPIKYREFVDEFIKQRNDVLPFNAQTTIASSYGLLQVMYTSAIRVHWKDALGPGTPALNPILLMDTPGNVALGDGSLHVGTVELLKGMAGGSNCGEPKFNPLAFATLKDFETAWTSALRSYNCWFTDKAGLTYGKSVMLLARHYLPTRADVGNKTP